jgi:hypothetical protein
VKRKMTRLERVKCDLKWLGDKLLFAGEEVILICDENN